MADRLVVTSRDTLAKALRNTALQVPGNLADHLVDSGVVRAVDPDDPALVARVADKAFGQPVKDHHRTAVRWWIGAVFGDQ